MLCNMPPTATPFSNNLIRTYRHHNERGDKISAMNERQQAHIDFYLERLTYGKKLRPQHSTSRLLAARDADEKHPLRIEAEATDVVEHLRQLEREQAAT